MNNKPQSAGVRLDIAVELALGNPPILGAFSQG
jgi:hypothetical protein